LFLDLAAEIVGRAAFLAAGLGTDLFADPY